MQFITQKKQEQGITTVSQMGMSWKKTKAETYSETICLADLGRGGEQSGESLQMSY